MTSVTSISQQIWDMKYRLKGPDGAPVDKTIEDSWWRVARALAEPEQERERWAAAFYEAMEGFRFLPAGRIVAGAGTERNVTLFNCFVMGAIPDDMARHLRPFEGSRPHHAAGWRHRLRLLDAQAQGRSRARGGGGCLGPALLHGRVGRHVPHHHECGLPPWCDDGDHALRPSRHRGLRRGEARARPFAHVQPLGPGDRRLHEGRSRRPALGVELRRHALQDRARARAVGPHHARDLRLCRAGRHLHRPHQPPQQPPLLRDHRGDQSLRHRRHVGSHDGRSAPGR